MKPTNTHDQIVDAMVAGLEQAMDTGKRVTMVITTDHDQKPRRRTNTAKTPLRRKPAKISSEATLTRIELIDKGGKVLSSTEVKDFSNPDEVNPWLNKMGYTLQSKKVLSMATLPFSATDLKIRRG